MFIIAFRTLVGTLATLKTFSKFDWKDLAVVLDEDEFESYKSWYLYYRDESKKNNPKIPVPVDVDFDIELVRTDRINVVYILNLLKAAKDGMNLKQEQIQANVDLILREIERSDNEALRAKADIMKAFIELRFYELPEEIDIQKAFEEFEKEMLQSTLERFSYDNELDVQIISDLFADFSFSGGISDESIRKKLEPYGFGLLKLTKLTEEIKEFITITYNKFRAEGE